MKHGVAKYGTWELIIFEGFEIEYQIVFRIIIVVRNTMKGLSFSLIVEV